MVQPGLIGVVCQDAARFSNFAASLTALSTPHGTGIKWVMGHQTAAARNEIIRDFLDSDLQWVFLLDDDHVFAEDILHRLLSHDRDIVVPICLTRAPPYQPTIFTGWEDWVAAAHQNRRLRLDLTEYPEGGLVPIHSAGAAGLLVSRRVLLDLEEPWFPEIGVGEDVAFFDAARALGYDAFCDLDAPLGHTTVATVWPTRQPSGWTYGWSFPGGAEIAMPGWEVVET